MNAEDIEQVLKNTFSLEFPQAKLTQKKSEVPLVYEGAANLTQRDDGCLILKLHYLYKSQDELGKELNASGTEFQSGQIIEDDHYFDFEGVDVSGRDWTSSRIRVSKDINIPSGSSVVTAPLQSLQTCWESTTVLSPSIAKTVTAQLRIPGKFVIPYLKAKFSIAGRSCVLEQHDSYLEIIADL